MRHIAVLFCLILAGVSSPGWAANVVETPQTRAVLLVERTDAAPGDTVAVGLKFTLKPGWHTYWRTPGDSGLPATVTWTLPAGVTAGALAWPPPSRIPTGDLMNFGYEGQVIFPATLAVDRAALAGSGEIKAHATWLACADVCIPEEGDFTVPLNIVMHPGESFGADAPELAQAKAQIPRLAPWPVKLTHDGTMLKLEAGPGLDSSHIASAAFFPDGDGVIENAALQRMTRREGMLYLLLKAGTSHISAVTGVLVVEDSRSGRIGYEVNAQMEGAPPSSDSIITIWIALLFAFAGGLLLNVMPCVLPVLVMKVLAVISGHMSSRSLRRDALVYTAGVMSAFTLLVSVLLIIRAGGDAIGWGFQLQNPIIVAGLANVMLVLGLSLSGVFTLGANIMGVGQGLTAKGGAWGTYFTGVLAVVVATPCTAPFMGAALGFALTQSPTLTIVIFEGLALGLAFPYLLIGFAPRVAHVLPRPGEWTERLKQILAFALYGAGAWLVWVLAQQINSPGLAAAFVSLLCTAFAAWCWGVAAKSGAARRTWIVVMLVAIALGLSAVVSLRDHTALPSLSSTADAPGLPEPFTAARLADLRAQGRPVFVDFTAAWCITCLVNERVALSRPEFADAIRARHIAYLKADWTNRSPEITAALHALGRDGVPVYVIYPPQGEPVLLPQILTPHAAVDALMKF